jgi:predicted nucleotidyltransferase
MNIKELQLELCEDYDKLLPPGLIHLGFRGSISFGTYVPPDQPDSIDDRDVMGVYIAPHDFYFGLNNQKEHKEKFIGHWAAISYEIRKFFRLLLKSNPNVLGQLWLKPDMVILDSPEWDMIIENRDIFASKEAYKSFAGYANGQLHRMTHMSFQGYMGPKRRRLVRKYGYDTKNASHLIRLLRMGIEFLDSGTMQIDRTDIDADELIAIKSGKYKLDHIKTMAEGLFIEAKKAKEASQLPEHPDWKKANELLCEILGGHHAKAIFPSRGDGNR